MTSPSSGTPFRRVGAECGKQLAGYPAAHPAFVTPGLVQANRGGRCGQVGGSLLGQRSSVPHAVQQGKGALELRHCVPRVHRFHHPVQTRRVEHRSRVGPRRLDAHPVERGHQTLEEGEAAESDQHMAKIAGFHVGEPPLGEKEGRHSGGGPGRLPEHPLGEPGRLDGIAAGGALDIPAGVLRQFDAVERLLPEVLPRGTRGLPGIIGPRLREEDRWVGESPGPRSAWGEHQVRGNDVVEAREGPPLVPVFQTHAEREPLLRRVERSDGVVQERERAVVVAEDRLEELARPVDGLLHQPLPQDGRRAPAGRPDPAVHDDETAAVHGEGAGVAFVEIPEQVEIPGEELHRLRRHGEQAVVEERGLPVGQQTKGEAFSRYRAVEDRVPPHLGRERRRDCERARFDGDRFPLVHADVQIGGRETRGGKRLAPGPRVAVRIGAHEEPAGVAQQEEPARLEEILQPVAGAGILLRGLEAHRAVTAARPAPLVQEGGDGFRVELHAGGRAVEEVDVLDGVEDELRVRGVAHRDPGRSQQAFRRSGDLDGEEMRPFDRLRMSGKSSGRERRQDGGRERAPGDQPHATRGIAGAVSRTLWVLFS